MMIAQDQPQPLIAHDQPAEYPDKWSLAYISDGYAEQIMYRNNTKLKALLRCCSVVDGKLFTEEYSVEYYKHGQKHERKFRQLKYAKQFYSLDVG